MCGIGRCRVSMVHRRDADAAAIFIGAARMVRFTFYTNISSREQIGKSVVYERSQ